MQGTNQVRNVENSDYLIYNTDSKYLEIDTTELFVLTEAPNLPADYIEERLNAHAIKTGIIFCDHVLNLDFPNSQYGWDVYRRQRNFFIPKIISKVNGIIFDPFAGYGYIGEVALGLKHKFIGVEIKSDIFDVLAENLNRCL